MKHECFESGTATTNNITSWVFECKNCGTSFVVLNQQIAGYSVYHNMALIVGCSTMTPFPPPTPPTLFSAAKTYSNFNLNSAFTNSCVKNKEHIFRRLLG